MNCLPQHALYDTEIIEFAKKLKIPYFIGVKMRDELPSFQPNTRECGILNLNTHLQKGSHWVCWSKRGKERYYFDSFGEPPPAELLYYLKTPLELIKDLSAIRCNAVAVQHDQSSECGSLYMYLLKQMSRETPYSSIIEFLEMRYNELPTTDLII